VKSSQSLRRQRDDVQAFADALRQLFEFLTPRPGSHIFDDPAGFAVTTGHEAEAQALIQEVNRLAGRAAPALQASGGFINWKPRGRPDGYWQRVNPATGWTTILSEDPMFDAATILAVCDQVVGMLDAAAEGAEDQEQTLEGRLAHAAGFWQRIRPTRRTHGAGVAQGVLGTLGVGVALAGIVHFLGWG
jgi:hypothetical protein